MASRATCWSTVWGAPDGCSKISSTKRISSCSLLSSVSFAPKVSCSMSARSRPCIILSRSLWASMDINAGCIASVPNLGRDLYGSTRQLQESPVLGLSSKMWPSVIDLSSSISQFGTPATPASGSCAWAWSPSTQRPSARAFSLTFSIIFCLVASVILGISRSSSSLSSSAFCFRWSRPPACSHAQARRETEPAPCEFAAREISANQNLRRSAMDSRRTVPSSSIQASS
mmetsp:Transcript_48318/g.134318  ORF Transcript_48318/g.134318 Transcript_48318/m.134318 type:complete len:229 (+) Transcript_48318:205-891(+)